MNIKNKLLSCYNFKNTREASKLLEFVGENILDNLECSRDILEQKAQLSCEIALAIFDLKLNRWDATLDLICKMPSMEIECSK